MTAIRTLWLQLGVANVFGILLPRDKESNFRIGDYRTIDWVHDSVKDQFRKKKLRSMTGIRGFIVNVLDSIEGWVLVGIIGTAISEPGLMIRDYYGVNCLLY